MVRKPPRRTAERILEVTLDLFNRFGEPNVSTTLISAELRISPGNLYYHYPAKDTLVNTLFDRYEMALNEVLHSHQQVSTADAAWQFAHELLMHIWHFRFLYRDVNDLLSKNRHLETRFQNVILTKQRTVRRIVDELRQSGALKVQASQVDEVANSVVLALTYWLSFEYVQAPRRALEPDEVPHALRRGADHVLMLLTPYLNADALPAADAPLRIPLPRIRPMAVAAPSYAMSHAAAA